MMCIYYYIYVYISLDLQKSNICCLFVIFVVSTKKTDWLVLFENCPLPTKRTRSIVSRSDFVTTKVKIRNGKPLQKELRFPTKRIKPIVTRWQEPFCTVQHKFLTVGNIAYMSTFPESRPFADICASLLGFCARFAVKNCPVFYFIIFIYWCRMWTPRLHSTSGWQLVQQKNAQFQSPSELSSVDAKKCLE